jgi:hypothetical protein
MTRTTPTRTQEPLRDRLMLEASRLTDEANKLPHGPLRDAMLRKARQSEVALHMDQWLSSPGLQAPC